MNPGVPIINQEVCTACGVCYEVCPSRFSAVQKLSGVPVPPPLAEDARAIAGKRKK